MSPALPREERDAIRAEAASLTEDPEFERSLHIGGMEQDLARFVLDRVPALLAALDAAHAETELYRRNEVTLANELSRARQDAAEFCGQRDEARAALAALRKWVGLLADDLERPDASTLAVKRVVAERLRAALAAAPSETEEGQ